MSDKLILAVVLSFWLWPHAAPAQETPAVLAGSYLDAVLDGDWETARALWSATDLAASRRLDVTYRDRPFKLDNASLLVLERERCRTGEIAVTVDGIETDAAGARISYRLSIGGESATVGYHATPTENGWRLVKPETALIAGWPRRRTEYLALCVQPTREMSEAAIRRLDDFVAETCRRLAVTPQRLEHLRTHKLGYVLADEGTVTRIVGVPTAGITLLQTDTVVTSEPCHQHELAHLLVNYALRNPPLYTLPVMQEGAAVALGGRWGRAPAVMEALGRFTLVEGFLELDDLLTWHGFHGHGADLTYAPAGLLAGYLLDVLGGDGFLSLYRDLSGDLADVQALEAATVRDRIRASAGMAWQDLRSAFDGYMEGLSCGGIRTADPGDGPIVAEVQGSGLALTIRDRGLWLRCVVETDTPPASGALLLLGDRPGPASRLRAERFPERPDTAARGALVFSQEEIGLYDFRTDLLLAKFVAGFCQDVAVASRDGGRLDFMIRRDVLPVGDWDYELVAAD